MDYYMGYFAPGRDKIPHIKALECIALFPEFGHVINSWF